MINPFAVIGILNVSKSKDNLFGFWATDALEATGVAPDPPAMYAAKSFDCPRRNLPIISFLY